MRASCCPTHTTCGICAGTTSFFRGFDVYLDQYHALGDPASLLPQSRLASFGAMLRLYGARVSSALHPGLTHVVIDDRRGCQRLDMILKRFALMRNDVNNSQMRAKHYVTPAWVVACLREGRVVKERDFLPQRQQRKEHSRHSKGGKRPASASMDSSVGSSTDGSLSVPS